MIRPTDGLLRAHISGSAFLMFDAATSKCQNILSRKMTSTYS